jgi:hypothetical protein
MENSSPDRKMPGIVPLTSRHTSGNRALWPIDFSVTLDMIFEHDGKIETHARGAWKLGSGSSPCKHGKTQGATVQASPRAYRDVEIPVCNGGFFHLGLDLW